MDFKLATLLCFAFFTGFNAHPSGSFNFVCRDGEEYDMCRSPCEPTCEKLRKNGGPINCSCVAGCFCRAGYVRARDNTCVTPEDCSRAQCQENEEYQECGSACALNCSNLHEGIFCTKPCRKGCFCKPNFVRNSKGKCVDPRTCGVVGNHHCPVNEQYVNCVNRCNTCWEDPFCRNDRCSPGCDCKYGYIRNSYGECVTEEQCSHEVQQQCRKHEIYTNCMNTCNYCVLRGRCDYEQYYCKPGCDCEPGFLRNERGVCVTEQECFVPACDENETFLQCGPSCRSTCGNYRSLLNHPCKEECVSGCFCRANFVIGPAGKCISTENCPAKTHSCPRGESFYQCLPTCRTTCRSLSNLNEVCSMECRPGCFCQPGFVRNDDRKCVRPSECPVQSHPPCPPGEVHYNCLPCRNTCDIPDAVCTQACTPGCECEKGLIRRRDGRCIRPSECRRVCGPNQEFRSCGTACPLTCENLENPRGHCISRCVRGCFCNSGFVLGPNERCILPQNCPNRIPISTGIEDRRRGTAKGVSTSTPVPSTTTTQRVTSVSISNSTDRATTNIETTDTTTAPSVTNATTADSSVINATTAASVTNATTDSSVTNATTAPSVTDTTVPEVTNTTTAPEATTSPITENTSLPTTQNSEPAVTTQTSEIGSVATIHSTEIVTSSVS